MSVRKSVCYKDLAVFDDGGDGDPGSAVWFPGRAAGSAQPPSLPRMLAGGRLEHLPGSRVLHPVQGMPLTHIRQHPWIDRKEATPDEAVDRDC